MTAGGVIPAPEERQPEHRLLGHTEDIDGLRIYVGVHHYRVCLEVGDLHLCLTKDSRDEFMRLWCEAERQADAHAGAEGEVVDVTIHAADCMNPDCQGECGTGPP